MVDDDAKNGKVALEKVAAHAPQLSAIKPLSRDTKAAEYRALHVFDASAMNRPAGEVDPVTVLKSE